MAIGHLLARFFEIFPEISLKNNIRYFLAFNRYVPRFISDTIPIKGYELNYKLKPGDVVVDAGAFTGDYTIFAAKKVGKLGRIIAFEPDKNNLKILAKNIKHEKLNNVVIIPKALWSENTNLKLEKLNGLHSSISQIGSLNINVARLDDELKKMNIKKVDFIKMDIEGAEIEAIKGAIHTLKRLKPQLAIASYHLVKGKPTAVFLESFFKQIGYNVKSDFPKHLTTYAWT